MSADNTLTPGPVQQGIDPRGPRFTAGVTAILLLVTIALALLLPTPWPAFALFAVLSALFALGAFAGITKGPWSIVLESGMYRDATIRVTALRVSFRTAD